MSEEEKIIEIPLDKIDEPELPARAFVDEEKLNDLTQSMAEVGQRDPIKVVKAGERYKIIDGHMRYLAMRHIGKQMIKAIVETPKDSSEALAWRLHANIHIPTEPMDEAEFFLKVIRELNIPASELAQRLHRSAGYIKSRLELLNYPEEIQRAIIEKKISLGVAKQLAKVQNETIRKDLVRRAVRDGLSESRAKIWAQQYSKVEPTAPPPPPEKIEREIKEMDEYYSTPCEVCGGKVKVGDLATISGHRGCIEQLRQAIEYEKAQRERERGETPGSAQGVGEPK